MIIYKYFFEKDHPNLVIKEGDYYRVSTNKNWIKCKGLIGKSLYDLSYSLVIRRFYNIRRINLFEILGRNLYKYKKEIELSKDLEI